MRLAVVNASVLANYVADDGPDGETAREAVLQVGGIAIPDLADKAENREISIAKL